MFLNLLHRRERAQSGSMADPNEQERLHASVFAAVATVVVQTVDEALATDQVKKIILPAGEAVYVVPDTQMLEDQANGVPMPGGLVLEVEDGRSVCLFFHIQDRNIDGSRRREL